MEGAGRITFELGYNILPGSLITSTSSFLPSLCSPPAVGETGGNEGENWAGLSSAANSGWCRLGDTLSLRLIYSTGAENICPPMKFTGLLE